MEIKDIKKKPSEKYFNMNETENDKSNDSKEKILIKFKILNGKKDFKYHVVIRDLSNNINLKNEKKKQRDDNVLQKSKIIICKYPDTPINLLELTYCYEFGKMQKLSVGLMIKNQTESKFINKEIIIGELIGNNKKNINNTQTFLLGGKNDEKLEISSGIYKKQKKFLIIHFYIDLSRIEESQKESEEKESQKENQENIVPNDKSEISIEEMLAYFQNEQNKIFFMIEKNGQKLYESEVFTDDGKFNIVQIPTSILEPNFNIIFYKFKKDKLGRNIMNENTKISTNLNKFIESYGKIICVKITMNYNLKIYNYSSIAEQITFLDYIKKGGIRIGLNIGIDFTNSNKPANDPNSLHSIVNKNQKNPYERAMLTCGKILEYYDYDLLFPVYGFGAVVNGETSYCFNINFEDNPEIELVDKIIEVYHECIQKILFSGPTYFAPIINKIISNMEEQNDPREYQVLMILTDGIIQDMTDTIDALVEASYYPLSVIIIGIGNTNFAKMEQLDGDEIPLISRKGIKRQRDLVQFVPFNKYEGDINKLVYEVLEEIPRQVIEYYTLNYLYPDMIKEQQEGKIKINNIDNFNLNNIKDKNNIESNINDSNIPINKNSYVLNNNHEKRIDRKISEETKNYFLIEKMFPKKAKKKVQQTSENNNMLSKSIISERQIWTSRTKKEHLNTQNFDNLFVNSKLSTSFFKSEDVSLSKSINSVINTKNNKATNKK